MYIKNARFLKGVIGDDASLHDNLRHIAFIGRSNVGKSSLINSITNKKTLAFSSSTPGRTLQINIYSTDDPVLLLDFPGFGYAKTDIKQREKIRKMILWYITVFEKKDRLFVLIIDSKVGLTDYDMEVIKIFKDIGIDYVLVANKADKLNQKETSKLKKDITSVLGLDTYVLYSTTKKMGTKELLSIINP